MSAGNTASFEVRIELITFIKYYSIMNLSQEITCFLSMTIFENANTNAYNKNQSAFLCDHANEKKVSNFIYESKCATVLTIY